MTDENLAVDPEKTLDEEVFDDATPDVEPSDDAASEVEPSEDATSEEEPSDEEKMKAKLKEAIEIEQEDIGPLRIKLTVTIPRDHLEERMTEQFDELKRDAQVPGFRKGHAPMRLIEKRFGTEVGDQLLTQVVGDGYRAAIEKQKINALGDPLFWAVVKEERVGEDKVSRTVEAEKLVPFDKALEAFTMPKEGPLSFSCEVELKPEFELPELDKIPVTRPLAKITDEDVESEVKNLRMMRGSFVPVEEGGVELDDLLYVDMTMSVGDEILVNKDNFDIAARDIRIEGVILEGLGEALIGKKPGDLATLEATIPDDHENIDIRGKSAKFEFTVREIKRLELPPIDEEFLKSGGFESESELRDMLRASMEARFSKTINRVMRGQISDHLIDNTKIEIPQDLSQRQTDRSLRRRRISMLREGIPETMVDKAMDELQGEARDQVVRDLKLYFILEKIA